jgi:CheY-like chemotaxis protein
VGQVLINLATNARDAMPRGGRLDIVAERLELDDAYLAAAGSTAGSGVFVCLTVTDTGTGMEARTRERLFEPFFTTKPPSQGTGLGMAMVYGLVKEHRGFINVYSEPGRGTTIRVYLPLAGNAAPAAPVAAPRARGGSETILIVEDEEMIRSSARRILERYGYRVLLAGDGEEALQLLRLGQDQVDLIVSDVVMPRLTGRQLLDTLRKAGNRVPFVYTSGYSALDARESAELDPSVPLLPKPWSASDLAAMVRQVLDGGPVRP